MRWQSILVACPQLAPLSSRFRCVPIASGATAFESCPAALAADATKLAEAAVGAGTRKCNVASCVSKEWSRANRLVGFGPGEAPGAAAKDPPESSCWRAGRCLHTPSGKLLFRCRNSLLKALKEEFGLHTGPKRKLLADSRVVMCIRGASGQASAELADFWGSRSNTTTLPPCASARSSRLSTA